MTRRSIRNVWGICGLAAMVVMAALSAGPAAAQDRAAAKETPKASPPGPDSASSTAASTAEKAAGKKAKKATGRLPMYYREVVDKSQRKTILAITEEFNAKIDALKAQVEALTKERDAQVAAVLTPEQTKKIEERKAAAQAKRESGKVAKASGPAKDQTPIKESTPKAGKK